MDVKLVTVGRTDVQWVKDGLDLYVSRLKHYVPFSVVEIPQLKNVSAFSQEQIKEKEGELILRQVAPGDAVVLLDERGKEYRSVEWADWIRQRLARGGKSLVFVIGGAYGFSKKVYDRAEGLVSLSRMTFSHQMVRTIFAEQLYRGSPITMSKTLRIRFWAGVAVVSVALALLVASLLANQSHPDTASTARDLGRRVEKRLALLDDYARQALEADPEAWLRLEDLPEDMVVYRYREDTLQSWAHQFPLRNDDIRSRTLIQRLGDGRSNAASPLAALSSAVTYVNYGPKWFLARSIREGDLTVIVGLEVINELKSSPFNGVNPRFRLSDRYSVQPLTASVGVPVVANGAPVFKIAAETVSEPERLNVVLFWLSIILFLAGTLILLNVKPTVPAALAAGLLQTAFIGGIYLYGRQLGQASQLFSPLLYADGPFFYSLGAVVLVNLLITALVLSLYSIRWTLLRRFRRKDARMRDIVVVVADVALIVAIGLYIHTTFKSIVFNSGICLELYKVNLIDGYTAVVYLSFLALTLTIPLLFQLISPLLRRLTGFRYDIFSRTGRLVFAVVAGAYFAVASSMYGFQKEKNRVEVWANRLAMDRDIGLELQLRAAEGAIAGDSVIGALSLLDNSHEMIRGRLVNSYLTRISQDYDISVVNVTPSLAADFLFNMRIRSGVRLADNSHFFYSTGPNSRAQYSGLFTYFNADYGSSSILVLVESKSNREDRPRLPEPPGPERARPRLHPAVLVLRPVRGRPPGAVQGRFPVCDRDFRPFPPGCRVDRGGKCRPGRLHAFRAEGVG